MYDVLLKNPGDDIDFGIQWDNLGAAVLQSVVHSVAPTSGLTKVGESTSPPNTSTVRLSGGAHGMVCRITGTATLNTGRTLVRTFDLRIFNG